MPSSWSPSLRLELQFTGENINLWGEKLNVVLQHADYSIAGWLTKALAGNYTLATANAPDDEARAAMLKFTGTGPYTVTIPSVSKQYLIWNACSNDLTVTTGAGATVVLNAGDKRTVFTDGAAVYEPGLGGSSIKAYVDNLAWTYNAGALPAQVGNSGKWLTTNGTTASWGNPFVSPVVTGGMTFDGAAKGNVVAVAASTLDVSAGEYQSKSISSNTTFTLTGATSGRSAALILELTTSSSAQPTFTGARWRGGLTPTFPNGTHLIGLLYNGSVWTAVLVGTQFS